MKETTIYCREWIRTDGFRSLQFRIRQKGYEVTNKEKSGAYISIGDWVQIARTRSRKELEKLQSLNLWPDLKICIACILGGKEDQK